MKKHPIITLISITIVFNAACFSADKDGFRPLLKRNSLSGWIFDVEDGSPPESIFKVEKGILYVNGKDKSPAVIRTKKDYSNYELKWQWRWPDEPGNSGCLIHVSTPRNLKIWPQSIEIQLMNEHAGDLVSIGEDIEVTDAQILKDLPPDSWKVRLRQNLTDGSEKAAGKWNQAHAIVKGDTVEVYINGDLVNKGWNATVTSGAICFQAEIANIEFRNIRIKELN